MVKRVLIVEDDQDIAEAVQDVIRLDAPHFETIVATDGAEGERRLTEDPRPCLVFLDLHMPGMGGDEFLRRKWSNDRTRNIPVVVMTATNESRTGVDHVIRTIHKPFDIVAILQEIDAHC